MSGKPPRRPRISYQEAVRRRVEEVRFNSAAIIAATQHAETPEFGGVGSRNSSASVYRSGGTLHGHFVNTSMPVAVQVFAEGIERIAALSREVAESTGNAELANQPVSHASAADTARREGQLTVANFLNRDMHNKDSLRALGRSQPARDAAIVSAVLEEAKEIIHARAPGRLTKDTGSTANLTTVTGNTQRFVENARRRGDSTYYIADAVNVAQTVGKLDVVCKQRMEIHGQQELQPEKHTMEDETITTKKHRNSRTTILPRIRKQEQPENSDAPEVTTPESPIIQKAPLALKAPVRKGGSRSPMRPRSAPVDLMSNERPIGAFRTVVGEATKPVAPKNRYRATAQFTAATECVQAGLAAAMSPIVPVATTIEAQDTPPPLVLNGRILPSTRAALRQIQQAYAATRESLLASAEKKPAHSSPHASSSKLSSKARKPNGKSARVRSEIHTGGGLKKMIKGSKTDMVTTFRPYQPAQQHAQTTASVTPAPAHKASNLAGRRPGWLAAGAGVAPLSVNTTGAADQRIETIPNHLRALTSLYRPHDSQRPTTAGPEHELFIVIPGTALSPTS